MASNQVPVKGDKENIQLSNCWEMYDESKNSRTNSNQQRWKYAHLYLKE